MKNETKKPAAKTANKSASKTVTKTATKTASKPAKTTTKTTAKTAAKKPAAKTTVKTTDKKTVIKTTVKTQTKSPALKPVTPSTKKVTIADLDAALEDIKKITANVPVSSKTADSDSSALSQFSKDVLSEHNSQTQSADASKPAEVPVQTSATSSTTSSDTSPNGLATESNTHKIIIETPGQSSSNLGSDAVKGKKKMHRGVLAGIVIAIVLAVIISLVFLYNTFGKNIFLSATEFGDYSILKTISISEDEPGSEPQVNLLSLATLDSIKEFTGAIVIPGNGQTIKEGDKVSLQFKQFVYSKYDFSTHPTSMEEAEASKFPDSRWQEYQNGWTTGQTNTFDAKRPESKSTIKTGSESSGAQTDPQLDQVQELLIGAKVGAQIAIFMPALDDGDGDAAGANPPQLLIFTVLAAGSTSDLSSIQSQKDEEEAQKHVTTEIPESFPEIKGYDNSEIQPEISIPEGFKAEDKIIVNVLERGNGEAVKPTDVVSARYSGWLLDGTNFDSSWKQQEQSGQDTTSFSLSRVISGWKYGLTGLPVGTKVELVIPSSLAYGEAGAGEVVPSNADLVFYVEIVEANAEGDSAAY